VNILIVDDQPQFRADMRALLSAALPEATVDEADSGSGSVSRLVDHAARSDVVFVDHRLSKVDGIKLLEAMKTRRPQLPVIFLSGGGDEMLVARAFKAGATDYLSKSGITHDSVRAAVKESLREQQGVARAMRTRAMREAADDIRIKGYKIEYRLARSALSAVYFARDVRGNKVVALKVMQGFAASQSGETMERFLREY